MKVYDRVQAKGSINNIKAMMFDLDGTLIDSVPAYYNLMERILESVGLPQAPRHLVAEFMTDGLCVLEKMIPEEMKDQKETLIQECITTGRKFSQNMFKDKIQVFRGVEELFEELNKKEILIGIVSSTEKRFIEKKLTPLARNGIRDTLDMVIAIGDVLERKPAPEPLLECARRLGVSPEQCIYVGDSRVDIQAGRAAGMMTIGVLTGLDDYKTLQNERANMILKSVDDIKELLNGNI